MAYGHKYNIKYKNRFQNDIYRDEIWEKDFVGDPTELTGAATPFTASYTGGDTDILTPIKTVELTIAFNTNTLAIEDFYSDDDQRFRVDHYFESDSLGGGTPKLLFSAYLVEDGVSEALTDRTHVITLKATDNLGLLKSVKWNETGASYNGAHALGYYIRYCLEQTGLYASAATIDMSLPLRLYNNLFETTEDDRSLDDTNDPFQQTILYAEMFQNSDGTWKTCYEVLEIVLKTMNAQLFQAEGYWNVVRLPEYGYFTDGAILGTEYIYNGVGTDVTALTLSPLIEIDRNGGDCSPINEDQEKAIQRPLKSVKNTFDFNYPQWIKQFDLALPEGATPYATNTVGDLRYDDYSLATYFPDWKQRNGDDSYLEVVTDTTNDTETERYIVTPATSTDNKGIEFNAIPVTAGDTFNFSLQFRTETDAGDVVFRIRFLLILPNDTVRSLDKLSVPTRLEWSDPFDCADYDDADAIERTEDSSFDSTQYFQWETGFYHFFVNGSDLEDTIIIPDDGMLLIQVDATNSGSFLGHQTTYWRDINLQFTNYINKSKQVTGQYHLDEGTSTIKAIEENDIDTDDSPRNTIAGTLFTDDISTFCAGIGNIYFTRTERWKRYPINERLRLGNIITQERLLLKNMSRSVCEGSFKNLRYDADKFVSLLSIFRFLNVPVWNGKTFAFASVTFDYMADNYNGKMVEIFNDTSANIEQINLLESAGPADTYTGFGTTQNLVFDSTVIETDFTDDTIEFTYTGADALISVETTVQGIWNSTANGTLNLNLNGTPIGSFSIGAGGVGHFFNGHISDMLNLTNGDVIKVSVDWTGSASYSLQIIAAGLFASKMGIVSGDTYTFNYLYEAT